MAQAEQSKPTTSEQPNQGSQLTDKEPSKDPPQGASETSAPPIPEDSKPECVEQIKTEDSKNNIKQPVIKLNRLTEEDQALLQKSLKQFVETKPERAKNLGIEIKEEEEDEAEEENTGKSRRTKRKLVENSDDEYQPDTFSALVSSNKKRKVAKEKTPEPIVMAKPKLRRVEKKFVPVLEKLSTEELMETNTYHRFNKSIEVVLRTAEDIDVGEIGKSTLHVMGKE